MWEAKPPHPLFFCSQLSVMADFILREALNPLLEGYLGPDVIGMQVRQVAMTPAECFVNGQLSFRVDFTLKSVAPCDAAPNPPCVACFKRLLHMF